MFQRWLQHWTNIDFFQLWYHVDQRHGVVWACVNVETMLSTCWVVNFWMHYSSLQDVAFNAIMVISNLPLQEPSRNSKSKGHLKVLKRRLDLWEEGGLTELLIEGWDYTKIFKWQYKYKGKCRIIKKIKRLFQER